jgi:taurine transport system substrate-binding protein
MYFSLVTAAQNSGVPIDKIDVVNAPVPDLVAAYKRGDLDGVYLPYPGLGEVETAGARIVLTSDQVAEKWNYPTFDACVVNAGWAKEHADVLTKWVQVEDKAVKYYQANAADSYATIAAEVGITPAEAQKESSVYHFPTAAEQLSPKWLGTPGKTASSGVATAVQLTGQLELKLQRITNAPSDPASVPNPTFVAGVQ